MPLEMPQADIPRLKAMLDVAEENLRALDVVSRVEETAWKKIEAAFA